MVDMLKMQSIRWFSSAVTTVLLATVVGVGCSDGGAVGPDSATGEDVGSEDVGDTADVAEPPDVDDVLEDVADAPRDIEGHDAGDAADVEEPPSTGYSSAELHVRVTSPDGAGRATVSAGTVRLSGLLFGNATGVQWQLGLQSGVIAPQSVWQSGPVALSEGDNRITVTATDGVSVASDVIVITFNTNYRFEKVPVIEPDFGWVGTETVAFAQVLVEPQQVASGAPPVWIAVDSEGGFVSEVGVLRDDGQLAVSGDEIAGDRVFTTRLAVDCETAGPRFFRARVPLASGGGALSRVVRFDCLPRVGEAACDAALAILGGAEARLAAGDEAGVVLADLLNTNGVVAGGRAAGGGRAIWVRFGGGFLGAVLDPAEGMRGGGALKAAATSVLAGATSSGPAIGSLRAVVASGIASVEGSPNEIEWFANAITPGTCPPLEPFGGVDGLGLGVLRRASEAGIMAAASHGEALFGDATGQLADVFDWRHRGTQETFLTTDAVDCAALSTGDVPCVATPALPDGDCAGGGRCFVVENVSTADGASGRGFCLDDTQVDLLRGRVVMTAGGYAVMPAFFERWGRSGGWARSVVYVGACRSAWNGSLAATFLSLGAATFAGYSDRIGDGFASLAGKMMLERVLASEMFFGPDVPPAVDTDGGGGRLRVIGASRVTLGGTALLNGDFGTGQLSGWTAEGDGRVIGRFGDATPVTGKFMGLLSTGLGYTVGTGSIAQTLCLPAEARELVFYWRFYSEEFREWCGDSSFQDTFSITASDAAGVEVDLLKIEVDDLCGYEDGACTACVAPVACDAACFGAAGCNWNADGERCEGDFNCTCGRYFTGLETSDVVFDQGGVWRTAWRENRVDLTRLAGRGPVTLRVGVSDSGDSLFDSAVLLDALVID